MPSSPPRAEARAAYRMIWRWHFYAGLFVLPFVALLSVTGGAYLFKPQIDAWEEARLAPPGPGAAGPVRQVAAALAAHPGAGLVSYRLPAEPGAPALVHLKLADGAMRDVFVSAAGRVQASRDPEAGVTAVLARLHGSLLLGPFGDRLVELAASWAFVMILTGLYLWWPRGRGVAGVLWPRAVRGRAGLRDLHAVTGFWVAGLALVTLASGLPWAGSWGGALRAARAATGTLGRTQDWKVGAARPEHAAHDHAAMAAARPASLALLPAMVAHARVEGLAFPALVLPPGAPQRFGRPADDWTIKSEAQDRTAVRSVTYDAATGRETGRRGFADKPAVDRLINYGISWHEGALFGWVNQLVGLLTALAMLILVVTSVLMWWRRRPEGGLGAPPVPAVPARIGGVVAIILVMAALLPLLGLSLIALLLVERLLLSRLPAVRRWLGLRPAGA